MDIKKTITSIFIVPTLSIPKEQLVDNGYINGYIVDENLEIAYENCVYLLFKPDNLDRFREFLVSEYERTVSVIDDYDYDNGYVVLVYKLNPKLESDIKLVKKGKYSQTSPAFQAIFPKIVKLKRNNLLKDEISLQYRIFNKTKDLKEFWEDKLGIEFDDDMEVWHGFHIEEEILNINKFKEYV
jgi:hypothetical protein